MTGRSNKLTKFRFRAVTIGLFKMIREKFVFMSRKHYLIEFFYFFKYIICDVGFL